jgi:aminopeptidase C
MLEEYGAMQKSIEVNTVETSQSKRVRSLNKPLDKSGLTRRKTLKDSIAETKLPPLS